MDNQRNKNLKTQNIDAVEEKDEHAKEPITFWNFFKNLLLNTIKAIIYSGIPFIFGIRIVTLIKFRDTVSTDGGNIILNAFSSTHGTILIWLFSFIVTSLIVIAVFQDINKEFQISKNDHKKVIGFLAIILAVQVLFSGISITSIIFSLFPFFLFIWLMYKKFDKNIIVFEKKLITLNRGIIIAIVSFVFGFSIIN